MKQIIQNYKTGRLEVIEVPVPRVRSRGLLVKTKASLISAGTERTKIETARMPLIEKAISRLDLVKTVMTNIKQEGLLFTFKKAFNKLDTPITLGYSCAGEVIEAGEGIKDFKIGDRVACVGENYAAHSEINSVPEDVTVKVPDNVEYEEASFVGLGAISLNSVELAQVLPGEKIAVIGLGLIGQLTAQILKSKGCQVLGIEIDENKIDLAKRLGIDAAISPLNDDILAISLAFTKGLGFDAVIISAASKNNLPIEIAGKIARYKGRVILVGAMPIIIPRKDYYEKELYFCIASGFGAGLYYKPEKGRHFPYNYKPAYIRDNMQNFLNLLGEKKVSVKPLITHRFSLEDAKKAYGLIRNNSERYLGVIFEYGHDATDAKKISASAPQKRAKGNKPISVGFIGAGSFAQGYLLPLLKKRKDVSLRTVANSAGVSASSIARKFGFMYFSTDYHEVLADKEVEAVFITTRHDLHAKLVCEALKKGKKVFVEKPLCLNIEELRMIVEAYKRFRAEFNKEPCVMVGFNRRFSPFILKCKQFFRHRTSYLDLIYRVNAGHLPSGHWLLNPKVGGGRILGEVCHFVDLLQYLANSFPISVYASGNEQDVAANIKYQDGSVAILNYNSIGDISFPRERIEIFGQGSAAVIDNFRHALFSCNGVTEQMKRLNRDMGYVNEICAVIDSFRQDKSLIGFSDLIVNTLTTFAVKESLENEKVINIDLKPWLTL